MATKPGKFDPDMLRERDLFAHDERHEPNWMDSADHLLTLRQWHRQLSEEIVATNRELALMLPLFCGVLSSRLTRLFCAVPRTSVSRIA